MRLGCEATAVDINPVAWFILKCTLEYPQKLAGQTRPLPEFILHDDFFMAEFFKKAKGYGKAETSAAIKRIHERMKKKPKAGQKGEQGGLPFTLADGVEADELQADLAWHVRAWGQWVLARARRELARYYPTYADFEPVKKDHIAYEHQPMRLVPLKEDGTADIDGLNADSTADYLADKRNPRWVAKPTVAYLWARTVTCKNCRASVPLLKTRWLCKKANKRVLLTMEPKAEGTGIKPTIQEDPQTHQHFGSYFCHRNEDIGPFKVDLSRRRRWKFSLVGLAKAVSKAVKPTGKVTELAPERLVLLGTVKLDGKVQELFLARGAAWPDAAQVFGNCSRLKMASHPAVLTLAAMPKVPLLAGCELAVRPLAEIANVHKGKLRMTLDAAFPEVEPGPWADIPNEPITLDQFMVQYCEKRSKGSRRSRRNALLGAARNHKDTIKMPPLACPYESGKSNKYFVHDLLKAWQGYQDENLDLPLLLPQYKTSSPQELSHVTVR